MASTPFQPPGDTEVVWAVISTESPKFASEVRWCVSEKVATDWAEHEVNDALTDDRDISVFVVKLERRCHVKNGKVES